MQCLYCGNRISLLRKLKDSEFCSDAHREFYQKEQTTLALARLTEAGSRMSQPRRSSELPETVEGVPPTASPAEELNPVQPFGFFPEPLHAVPPRRSKSAGLGIDWLSATAIPALFEAPEAAVSWQPAAYCRPALDVMRTGTGGLGLRSAVPQADFKPGGTRLPVLALTLDKIEPAPREAAGQEYAFAPALPVPLPFIAPPALTVPCSTAEVGFKSPPPGVESNLLLPALQPSLAGGISMQPTATPPRSGWISRRAWPAIPRVGVQTLMDGPFQRAGVDATVAGPGWASLVPVLAPRVAKSLMVCPCELRAPELVAAIAGTTSKWLPEGVSLAGAELRLAYGRLPKPCAQPGSTGVDSAGIVLAGSTGIPVNLPTLTAPGGAGMPAQGGLLSLAGAEPRLACRPTPELCVDPGSNSLHPAVTGFAATAGTSVSLPALTASVTARLPVHGRRVSLPIKAFGLPVGSAEMADEVPVTIARCLPEFAWSADSTRLTVEAGWSLCEPAMRRPTPRAMAGLDRVTPVTARAKGGRKVGTRTTLPLTTPPLVEVHLAYVDTLLPLMATRGVVRAPNPSVPPPGIQTPIPSRRRPELKSIIALPSSAGFLVCRGMASSTNLHRLNVSLESVENWRGTPDATAQFMRWMPFPAPAMPSSRAGLGGMPLSVVAPSIRTLTRLFSINLGQAAPVAPPKPVGAAAQHTICRPARLPSFGAPQDGNLIHERTSALLSSMMERTEGSHTRWALARLWRRTPLPVKGVVAGVALLGGLAAMGDGSSSSQWNGLREEIRGRAAVELVDDFRTGMGAWSGGENWAETWSYDNAGFVQPGNLALYRPSMTLANYRFEFLGQIATKGMGWVFRAVDTQNYYAMKIVCTNKGPMPAAAIVRYAVIDGKMERKRQSPLPMGARTDLMYRIRVDVDGENFTAQFQDQIVDVWSDKRLAAGGVGFFSDKGEKAKIRWIEVSNHSDFLGKLCAYLVPFEARGVNRSYTR
jgi:hypothetical protein